MLENLFSPGSGSLEGLFNEEAGFIVKILIGLAIILFSFVSLALVELACDYSSAKRSEVIKVSLKMIFQFLVVNLAYLFIEGYYVKSAWLIMNSVLVFLFFFTMYAPGILPITLRLFVPY